MNKNLSKRIASIINLTSANQYIYDLCCDHGEIGLGIYEKFKTNPEFKELIFNDQVSSICSKLKDKITSIYSYIPKDMNIQEGPCGLIDFKENSTIVIVGVGYDTVKSILDKLPKHAELIISSHTKPLEMRQLLSSKLKLKEELLVYENKQFYEILKLDTYAGQEIPKIGNFTKNEQYQLYLEQLASHFKLKATYGNDTFSKEILKIIELKQKEF